MDDLYATLHHGLHEQGQDRTRPTVVLIHGAWHGPWCWASLQFALRTCGWDSTAPRLRSVPLTDIRPAAGLRDDVSALLDHIDHIHGPVVLVAHSYAGMPATEVAALRPGKVTQLIYLAAYVPRTDDNLFSIHGMSMPPDVTGTVAVPDDPIPMLYADVDRTTALAAAARLRPQSLRSWTEHVEHADTSTTPITYLLCADDQALPVAIQEQFAARCDRTVRLDSGHSPFLSKPHELAACIERTLLDPPQPRGCRVSDIDIDRVTVAANI